MTSKLDKLASAQFLVGDAILPRVKEVMTQRKPACAAIAYWGKHGVDASGLLARGANDTRVVCDLFSGACDPAAIGKLVAAGVAVKTLDGMHAKVWSCGDDTILGSANASANGVGEHNSELKGNIEADVWIRDPRFAEQTRAWFETLWSNSKAVEVGAQEIESAKPLWDFRRAGRKRQSVRTLADAARTKAGRAAMARIRAIAYTNGSTSPQADKQYELNRSSYTAAALAIYPGEYPFYEDEHGWDVRPGDVILDFFCERKGSMPRLDGIWRVRDEDAYVKAAKPGFPRNRIVLCDPVLDLNGYRLAPKERDAIASKMRALAEANQWRTDVHHHYVELPILDLL